MSYKSNFVEANPHLVYSDEVDTAYDPAGGGGGGGEEYDLYPVDLQFRSFDFDTQTIGEPITKARGGEPVAVLCESTLDNVVYWPNESENEESSYSPAVAPCSFGEDIIAAVIIMLNEATYVGYSHGGN